MFVNTKIVNALLILRRIPRAQLCMVTGISPAALSAWLDETIEDSDERLSFDRQLEVLKVLGVVGDNPRRDVVHNWTIQEPAFGLADDAYEPLRLILSCFGKAEVVHLSAERDSLMSFSSKTFFGLTFSKFRAVLEILTPVFRSLSFNPQALPNLSWSATGAALVVDTETFKRLTSPGEATPAIFDQERVAALEHYQWQNLIRLTHERGVGATEVVKLVLDTIPNVPALHGPQKTKRKTTAGKSKRAATKQARQKAEGVSSSVLKTTDQAADGQPLLARRELDASEVTAVSARTAP